MKYYLTGPITGYADGNRPAFTAAAGALRKCGYEIINPFEVNTPEEDKETLEKPYGTTYWNLLGRDVEIIGNEANGIIFLPGWENSKGARLEAYVGLLNNHPIFEYSSTPDEGVVLTELPQRLVAGVCAAEWCPKDILKKLGLLDAA